MTTREHDIVVWGATGFTGQIVAEYLLKERAGADDGLRVALGGRSRAKLEAVAQQVGAPSTPLIVADSMDRDSLDAVAGSCKVVLTTVGPYSRYGAALVDACVSHGTDYCDLSGETPFVRKMIDKHHEQAHRAGSRIVNCCGYDSIPSDLGTLMVQQAFQERFGRPASQVKGAAGRIKGKFSGGTVASFLAMIEQSKEDPSLRKILGDPYGLNPSGVRGSDGSDQMSVRYDDDFESWTAPFVMAAINTRVVRRSHALMGLPWGEDFGYSEFMTTGRGSRGFVRATAITAGLAGIMTASVFPLTKPLVERKLPSPGEGPSRAERKAGMFEHHLLAMGEGDEVRGKVVGPQDPGYGSTAIMMAESGLCLLRDDLESEGGVLTPASAMGHTLIERLRRAGLEFDVVD